MYAKHSPSNVLVLVGRSVRSEVGHKLIVLSFDCFVVIFLIALFFSLLVLTLSLPLFLVCALLLNVAMKNFNHFLHV